MAEGGYDETTPLIPDDDNYDPNSYDDDAVR